MKNKDWTRANLNRRPLAQETLVYPSELSTTRHDNNDPARAVTQLQQDFLAAQIRIRTLIRKNRHLCLYYWQRIWLRYHHPWLSFLLGATITCSNPACGSFFQNFLCVSPRAPSFFLYLFLFRSLLRLTFFLSPSWKTSTIHKSAQSWQWGLCPFIILPWPKKSLQPRNSWGWSAVWSCDIVRYRASVWHRRGSRYLRVASSRCRSKSMLHDITWSHCRSISWISRLWRFFWPG